MKNIQLRQIKIFPKDGRQLSEKQVKKEIARAQRLMDSIDAIFNAPINSKNNKGR